MGRWKPPAEKSSPYITATGARALKAELQDLWRRHRPAVVKALSAAAAEGDRSENAEYTYRKKQLGEIDRRIRYLSKRLDVIQIVSQVPTDRGRVRFGAWVELRDATGQAISYRIVGADETDAKKGWISIDSPLARALVGTEKDDRIVAELPQGKCTFTVLSVTYKK